MVANSHATPERPKRCSGGLQRSLCLSFSPAGYASTALPPAGALALDLPATAWVSTGCRCLKTTGGPCLRDHPTPMAPRALTTRFLITARCGASLRASPPRELLVLEGKLSPDHTVIAIRGLRSLSVIRYAAELTTCPRAVGIRCPRAGGAGSVAPVGYVAWTI